MSPIVLVGVFLLLYSQSSLGFAKPNQNQQGDVHDDQDKPDQSSESGSQPIVSHVELLATLFTLQRVDGHDVTATGEPDQRRRDKGQNHTEADLTGGQSLIQTLPADGSSNDDTWNNADGTGDESAHPWLNGPMKHTLRHHLAGHGTNNTGRGSREQQRNGKESPSGLGQILTQKVVYAKEVRFCSFGLWVEGRTRDDENGRVDEQGKREERGGEFDDGILQARLDRIDGGDVLEVFVVLFIEHDMAVLSVKILETRLDDSRAQEDGMRHDSGTDDAAREVDPIALDNGRGRKIASEDLTSGGVLQVGELNTEADHDAQDQTHDKELKQS